jgi:hypothetical protein
MGRDAAAWLPGELDAQGLDAQGLGVQGSIPYALVMAPPNAADKNPDVYFRKLVVMLQSRDATAPPAEWASQPVNGRPGKFDVQVRRAR